ncbi:hypothetical protein [Quadrisphaera sp. KR29]|uniref:hypothetical protein n=1 Tax=Quadrisphaera sp. KR29 TaxID=3461391 RepID=UPI00404460FB
MSSTGPAPQQDHQQPRDRLDRQDRQDLPGARDAQDLRAACDRLVEAAADPAAARAAVVAVWALGACAADDLLADLRALAAGHAARTGAEPGAADLLDALGRHAEAAAHRRAVGSGLREHRQGLLAAARARAAQGAARAAVRLAGVAEHRRPGEPSGTRTAA